MKNITYYKHIKLQLYLKENNFMMTTENISNHGSYSVNMYLLKHKYLNF